MRRPFDHLAKQLGKAALASLGHTAVHDEIAPEPQHADLRHEPDPARARQRRRLGLLGRLTALPCLLEIYGHAPAAPELRACLAKHLAFWQRRARDARARARRARGRRRPRPAGEPRLWIIAAGTPRALLTKLRLTPATGWPPGVYCFGDDVLRVGIVAANELPRSRATLLVRLMAAGPLLAPAIEDLARLPPRAHERAVAEHILLSLQLALSRIPRPTPEQQEFIVTVRRSWEDARMEGRTEGRTEGRAEGRVEGCAEAVLAVLAVRRIPVPAADRKRILAEQDLSRLQRWLERATVAPSIEKVFESQARPRSAKTSTAAARRARPEHQPPRRSARRQGRVRAAAARAGASRRQAPAR